MNQPTSLSIPLATVVTQETRLSDRFRLSVVGATIGLSILAVLVCAGKPWSNGQTAAILGIINSLIFLTAIVLRRDAVLGRLMLFGAVFGIVELIADALCVHFTGTLDYSISQSPMLVLSPWWMPVAWMIVVMQIGYLGAWLGERMGLWRGALLTAFLGAVNIPFYEEMAYYANWWQYRNCALLPGTHTPYYIVVAELIIGMCLAPLAYRTMKTHSLYNAVVCGVLGGISTIAGGLVGYGLMERVIPLLLHQRTSLF